MTAHLKFSLLDYLTNRWRLIMFARNVSLRLKPNTLSEFTRIFDKEVIPMLRTQSGFRDEITFAVPGGLDVVAISLWDTKEYAEAYNTVGYPEVLKILDKVLDGTPKVQVSDVISSTIHKPAVGHFLRWPHLQVASG